MIKAIIEYKLKKGADIESVLLRLRSKAMTYPGFVSAENLENVRDSSLVATIQTWEAADSWWTWETSKTRENILREAAGLLAEPPKVNVYRLKPTVVTWAG